VGEGNAVTGEHVDLLDRVRAVRRARATAGPPRSRGENDFELVALPTPDCDFLRDLLIRERVGTVIEVGLAYGSSALAIGEALVTVSRAAARHLIIDAYQDHFHRVGWDALVLAGLAEFCSLIEERSLTALARLVAQELRVDAAFVDGSHVFHNVFVDLVFLRELVRPGGLVVLDDCHWPSVSAAARYFVLSTGWRPEPPSVGTRLRAFRLPETVVEPRFEDFQPFT
jgi:predicted O-methyltransferase YrrM